MYGKSFPNMPNGAEKKNLIAKSKKRTASLLHLSAEIITFAAILTANLSVSVSKTYGKI